MDIVALVIGFAIVWLFGVLLVAVIDGSDGSAEAPGRLAWLLGTGWLVGAFVLTLWMRALSLGGMAFGIAAIGGPLALATLVLGVLHLHRNGHVVSTRLTAGGCVLAGHALDRAERIAWFALLGWLALRYALLLAEVVWRPLYPWDAWAQWATKARVWFELRRIVPFLPLTEWLAAGGSAYIDPTPHYPATVPLWQVWGATLLGRWDDSLVNLPWWLTGIALALVVYGFLAQQGFAALGALAGTWLVASLPIGNVHVALAGYADLPMAAYITAGVLAGLRWVQSRRWRDALPTLLLLAAWVTVKNPGKAWLLVMLPAAIVALLPRHGVKVATAMLALAGMLLAILAQTSITVLGYRLHLDFNLPARGLFDAYFAYGNWHLLWFGAIGAAMLGWRQAFSREVMPLTIVIGAGLLFLMFGFAFTTAGAWVEDQTTVNRATLHIAPLVAVWMIVVFRQWAAASSAVATPAAGIAPPAPRPGVDAGSAIDEAQRALAAGRLHEAVAQCERILATEPDNIAAHRILGEATLATNPRRAEEAWQRVAAAAPNDPEASFYLGNLARARGDIEGAIGHFEASLAAAPGHPDALNNLGLALRHAGRIDDAVERYRSVLAIDPTHADALGNLAEIQFARREYGAAADTFARMFAVRTTWPPAVWLNRGTALQELGDAEASAAVLRDAVTAHPDDSALHRALAKVLTALGRAGEAHEVQTRAQALERQAWASTTRPGGSA